MHLKYFIDEYDLQLTESDCRRIVLHIACVYAEGNKKTIKSNLKFRISISDCLLKDSLKSRVVSQNDNL